MSPRQYCSTCLRPQATCICHLVRSVSTETEVVILQHPDEVRQAKGTARLLHLCLPNSQIIVGESFEHHETVRQLLADDKQTVLLYPENKGQSDQLTSEQPASHSDTVRWTPGKTRLLVIDGSWRKSRKIVHLNPHLITLPRLAITGRSSHYSIRKNHHPGQLSTLEAVCESLSRLEGPPSRYAAILSAFEKFMLQFEQYIPKKLQK